MRIVAGRLGGRKIQGPTKDLDSVIRPTTDRVRESVFNALTSLDAIDNASVVDLFAGTGACGIEALSRGAGVVTFVDASHKACRLIESNLASLNETGKVVRSDAIAFCKTGTRFDVAFIDPPYGWDQWEELLASVNAGVLVCEESSPIPVTPKWELIKVRRYGQTTITILEEKS